MIELERTFLAKYLPTGWKKSPSRKIIDIYYPKDARHPVLRLRLCGGKRELTKKTPIDGQDSSRQFEETIKLSKKECEVIKKIPGKISEKIRYYYPYKKHTAEIAVFGGKLSGLVLIDFEFSTDKKMKDFEIPDFCLADVTQEEFVAGGMLCGKSYSDIQKNLKRYGYKPID